jgi:dihydroorotase
MTEKTITLTQPDDWHLHLRDDDALPALVKASARWSRRAIVMPNLKPPITTTPAAIAYRERILAATQREGVRFEPLMTLYLTDNTTPEEIRRAHDSGIIYGVKLYPAGATTNSDAGVTKLAHLHPVLEQMSRVGLPLLIHAEVTDDDVDIFDRERVFIERTLLPLVEDFDGLKIVVEHITTREAAHFVAEAPDRVGATITAHHLRVNRNAMLVGGIRPHFYCLPVLKRERDRQSLIEAAISGSPKFFLGTDSAPHARSAKETVCGCAGCFTALTALELYAEVFEEAGALQHLETFASFNGPDFYGLERNEEKITLIQSAHDIPEKYLVGGREVRPFMAGQSVRWRLAFEQSSY